MRKVSVVIPTFNHEKYVCEAIESVFLNTEVESEVIVINDGSTDGTDKLLRNFRGIRYYVTPNKGAYSALNYGIGLASNPLIAILNDDDIYLQDHLIDSIMRLESTASDFLVSNYEPFGVNPLLEEITNHSLLMKERIPLFGLQKTLLLRNWAVSTSAYLFKKDLFERIGGFNPLSMCHDYEFLLGAIFRGSARVYYSEKIGWLYRCHGHNSSSVIASDARRAQWYAATFAHFRFFPVHLKEFLLSTSEEHLGLARDQSIRIIRDLENFESFSDIDLVVGRIATLIADTSVFNSKFTSAQ